MSESHKQESYTLYKYIQFFYQKKLHFAILAVFLFTGAILLSFLQPTKYEGSATFYVGDIEVDNLTDPDLIKKKYYPLLPVGFTGRFDVISPSNNKIMVTITGNDKSKIENTFKTIVLKYNNDLDQKYTEKKHLLTSYRKHMSQKISDLRKLEDTHKKHSEGSLSEQLIKINELLVKAESDLLKYDLDEIGLDKPQLTDPILSNTQNIHVQEKRLPIVSNILIATLLAIILSAVLLILWRYVTEAKAYHDEKG